MLNEPMTLLLMTIAIALPAGVIIALCLVPYPTQQHEDEQHEPPPCRVRAPRQVELP
ncbi:hypothetical protein [Nocardia asteroides]|uniref:hypothetical protein n=1 Tax=Nocardia asteroides TaxID=1824 RepID=UPI001E4FFD89|nr:hypothetical protein [Nocardia asteroides]UGT60203.1 hypothetical protein LTT61_23770 [Nocardia asteroides]